MPGLIRWRHKDPPWPRRALFQVVRRSAAPRVGVTCTGRPTAGVGRLRRLEEASITSRGQTMAKNEPRVPLNRPQDTERYNAKDSIVTRAVKCPCLVSKTKWATFLSPSRLPPFRISLSGFQPVPLSPHRHLLVNFTGSRVGIIRGIKGSCR